MMFVMICLDSRVFLVPNLWAVRLCMPQPAHTHTWTQHSTPQMACVRGVGVVCGLTDPLVVDHVSLAMCLITRPLLRTRDTHRHNTESVEQTGRHGPFKGVCAMMDVSCHAGGGVCFFPSS
uniref:Secreted protein n=1 Tax=Vitrella brassicaformis TaxID=1169539 RepID=A0A7S1PCT4_9ALVE